MSCKSALYTANETITSAIPSGSVLPLGTVIRRFGNNIDLSGNGILVGGAGYYDVDASFTVTPSTTDTITVQLYKDGVPVPGASATGYSSGVFTLPIPAIVRLNCCDNSATLNFVATAGTAGTTITLRNAAVVVEKI